MSETITDKPVKKASGWNLWIWVILAFVLLISAWTTLIMVANKHKPAAVPLETSQIQKAQEAIIVS